MKKGLEWQVSSLESSIELMDLGVRQSSHFVWAYGEGWKTELFELDRVLPTAPFNITCAFTVAELLDLLPDDTELSRRQNQYYICNCDIGDSPQWVHCRQDSLNAVEACAKMLIYLIKNKLIKVSR